MDRKGPDLLTYAECYTELLDDFRYTNWRSGNVQIPCGVRWGLAVVDLDGPEAADVWCTMHQNQLFMESDGDPEQRFPDTIPWIARSGGGGLHLYYTIPRDVLALPSRFVWGIWDYLGGQDWKGAWQKGANIEILADNKLVIAPPSIHPDTGNPYVWVQDYGPYSPDRGAIPGFMPGWIMDLPPRRPPDDARPPDRDEPDVAKVARENHPSLGEEYDRVDVLGAIPDKAAVARSWGLEFTTYTPNDRGWLACKAISRATPGSRSQDEHPSARFNAESGVYMEMYERGLTWSFFDLAVRLGRYSTWRDCVNDLGKRFGAPLFRDSGRTMHDQR